MLRSLFIHIHTHLKYSFTQGIFSSLATFGLWARQFLNLCFISCYCALRWFHHRAIYIPLSTVKKLLHYMKSYNNPTRISIVSIFYTFLLNSNILLDLLPTPFTHQINERHIHILYTNIHHKLKYIYSRTPHTR